MWILLLCLIGAALGSNSWQTVTTDCQVSACATSIDLEYYDLQLQYGAEPDNYRRVYFFNSNGTNIGRIGWEPDKLYLEGCGADSGWLTYLVNRTKTSEVRVWTLSKSSTHFTLYCNGTKLFDYDFSQDASCKGRYSGDVVSKVGLSYFKTVNGNWRENTKITLKTYQKSVVKGADSTTISCKVTSNGNVSESLINWSWTNSAGQYYNSSLNSSSTHTLSFNATKTTSYLKISKPTETTNYTCDYYGTEATKVLKLHVLDYTLSPRSNAILKGESETLSCALTESQYAAQVQWYYNDALVRNDSNVTGQIINSTYSASSTGLYKCVTQYFATHVDDFVGAYVNSSVATLNVIEFIKQPVNQTVLTGNSADLSCVVPSVPYNVVVQWYNGNVVVQADSTSKINTQHTSSYKTKVGGSYHCKANYTAAGLFRGGVLSSDTALVSLIGYIQNPLSQNIAEGQSTTLTCKLGTSAYSATVKWFKDGSHVGSVTTTQANQENIVTYKVTGSSGTGGEYKCSAYYATQGGLEAGTVNSTVASVTITNIGAVPTFAEPSGSTVITCYVRKASQAPDTFRWLLNNAVVQNNSDYSSAYTAFTGGAMNSTLTVKSVQADTVYTCNIGWGSQQYNVTAEVDMIEIKSAGIVNGLVDSPSDMNCTVTQSKTQPSSVYWNDGTNDIMAKTTEYSPSKTAYTDFTQTATLTVTPVTKALNFTCIFVYGTLKFSTTSRLKVIEIAGVGSGALQNTASLSTVQCTLGMAQSQPTEVYWRYQGANQTSNVTTGTYSNGTQSTTIKYYGVDSDSRFFCHFVWGQTEVVQSVLVEVGEMFVGGLVLKQGASGKLTCSIKDFAAPPSRLTWYKDNAVLQNITIEPSSTTTAWMFGLDSVESKDAAKYTCSITVGNDQLSMVNHLTVIQTSVTQPSLTKQGSELVLSCSAYIWNNVETPNVTWSGDGKSVAANASTTLTNNVLTSNITLTNVDARNEVPHHCHYHFTEPEKIVVEGDRIDVDILTFKMRPVSQYGKIGDTALFTCEGETGNTAAGDPTVRWYSGTTLIKDNSTTYALIIPTGGYDVTCKITFSKSSLVLTDTVSAIISNWPGPPDEMDDDIAALDEQYTTAGNASAIITCTYTATSQLGLAPTQVKWFSVDSANKHTDLAVITGYQITTGVYSNRTQTTNLEVKNILISHDKNRYRCEFKVENQFKIRDIILRVVALQFNVAKTVVTYKSGQAVNIIASPVKSDYQLKSITYKWTNVEQIQVQTGSNLTFSSIRTADASKYNCIGRMIVPHGANTTRELTKIIEIEVKVTPACRIGTIANVKNTLEEFVDNGWTEKVFCKDDYLLSDQGYDTYQQLSCSSSDYTELSHIDCVKSCVLDVKASDTTVVWNKVDRSAGKYNLYYGEQVTVSCNTRNNRTLPLGANTTLTCGASGVIDFPYCVDGCQYKTNSHIKLMLPEAMYNEDLIPIGESVSYECKQGEATIYNPSKKFTCQLATVNSTFINFEICESSIPWDWIIIGFAIFITIIALIMIVFGGVLYFKRQRRIYHKEPPFIVRQQKKLATLRHNDVYSNPSANKEDVELVELFEPIGIPQFHMKYKQLIVDDCYSLSLEYARIGKVVPASMFPITVAKQPIFKDKNRFIDILPFDSTRVVLAQVPGVLDSHYINASFIDSFDEPQVFIAAQGPKPETLDDFWRMIWEQQSTVIIMVTNFNEKGRKKCEEYWKDTKPQTYGRVTVECIGIVSFPDYKVRKFSVTCGTKSRIMTHYHYEGWPDHGVPDAPTSMISFCKRAFSDNHPGPYIIHCSAGVGRTGTLIALHIQMQNIKDNERINIYDTVVHLRKFRKLMVQTESQYVFLYKAVNEILRSGDSEIFAQMLAHAYKELARPLPGSDKTGITSEYQRLVYIAKEDPTGRFVESTKEYNHSKNRYHNILPFEHNRVKLLHKTGIPGSDYINASYISSYHEKNAYIATQAPKEGTVDDFWRMIYETGASTIIMMTNIMEEGKIKCAKYWPQHDSESVKYGDCKVKLMSVEESQDVIAREFSLSHKDCVGFNEPELIEDDIIVPKEPESVEIESAASTLSQDRHSTVRKVRMWHFTTLTEKAIPINGLNVISVIEQMQRWQKQQGNMPAVVHCSGGVGRAGAYIAISNCLEQLKLEGTVDVFQTVLHLRRQRPFMVQSKEQYEYIYKSLVELEFLPTDDWENEEAEVEEGDCLLGTSVQSLYPSRV